MAFTKTSSPVWHIDDTYANVAAAMKAERVLATDVMGMIASSTSGNIVVFVKKGSYS
jgi:hypothetical protein